MSALAIIQGGEHGHPFAPPWYDSNPIEPIGDGTISVSAAAVVANITLESVLDLILDKKPSEVVVVAHGWEHGLAIPVSASIRGQAADDDPVGLLAEDGRQLVPPVTSRSDAYVATTFGTTEETVRNLRTKMNQVRAMKLKHVAFRACELGAYPFAMKQFMGFFGAASVSAPKLKDSYGKFAPTTGDDLEAWVKTQRKHGYYRTWIDHNVAFGITKPDPHTHAYQIASRVADTRTFKAWVIAHVSDSVKSDQVVVYHGMFWENASMEDPAIYFVRDADFLSNIVLYPAK